MPGLSSGLNIGLSGLTSAQAALDVVGNNIANVNTPGYSRELPNLSSTGSQSYGNLNFGTGVTLATIQGIRDQLLNQQVIQSTSQQYGASTRYQGLQSISAVFTDDGTTGLQSQLNQVFTNLQKLSAQPNDTSLRSAVVGSAKNFVSTLQTDYQTLQSGQTGANQQVSALVPQINTITTQIAALNKQLGGEATSTSDNAAIDQRQALANQLGQLVGVQTYVDGSNQMNISLDGGAAPLVVGSTAYVMGTTNATTTAGFPDVTVGLPNNAATDVTSSIKNGQLGAQLDLRDNLLPGYETQLNQVAAGFAYNMNNLQSNGYAYDPTNPNNPAQAVTGIDFFVGTSGNTNHLPTGSTAANNYANTVMTLSVNAAIVANPNLIAASGTPGTPGDNSNINKMIALQTNTGTIDTTQAGQAAATGGPFSTFITNLFTQVGNDNQNWKATTTNQENITTALTTQANSVSGVDLDTEATNLITYQRGYQAAASFVSTISTLMNNLITSLGK